MALQIMVTYSTVRPLADGETVARTVEVGDDLLVDVDDEGRVLGIETLGRPLDLAAMFTILRSVRIF